MICAFFFFLGGGGGGVCFFNKSCFFFWGGGGERCSVYIHTCFFIWTQIYVSVPNLEVGVFPATDNDYPAHLPKTRFAS